MAPPRAPTNPSRNPEPPKHPRSTQRRRRSVELRGRRESSRSTTVRAKVSLPRASLVRDECVGALRSRFLLSFATHGLAGVSHRRRLAPPRGERAPAIPGGGRASPYTRRTARNTFVPSARPLVPSLAVAASTATTAMAPPWPGHPSAAAHQLRSTVDRAPHARTRSTVDRPVPSRHVASQASHLAPP